MTTSHSVGLEDVQIRLWRLVHRYMLLKKRTKLPSEVAEYLDVDKQEQTDHHLHRSFNERKEFVVKTGEKKKDRDGLPTAVAALCYKAVRKSDRGSAYGSTVRELAKAMGVDARTLMDYSNDELERLCAFVSRKIDVLVNDEGDIAVDWPKGWRAGYVGKATK